MGPGQPARGRNQTPCARECRGSHGARRVICGPEPRSGQPPAPPSWCCSVPGLPRRPKQPVTWPTPAGTWAPCRSTSSPTRRWRRRISPSGVPSRTRALPTSRISRRTAGPPSSTPRAGSPGPCGIAMAPIPPATGCSTPCRSPRACSPPTTWPAAPRPCSASSTGRLRPGSRPARATATVEPWRTRRRSARRPPSGSGAAPPPPASPPTTPCSATRWAACPSMRR